MLLKEFYPEHTILCEVPKDNSKGEVVRLVEGVKKGQIHIDLRTYYPVGDEMHVGKGVAVTEDQAYKLIDALNQWVGKRNNAQIE